MPQRSQDAYETLNPGAVPITPNELRSRSNSIGSKSSSAVQTIQTSPRLSLTPSSEVKIIENPFDQRLRERTITAGEYDMDESIINGLSGLDGSHNYKRELDHR